MLEQEEIKCPTAGVSIIQNYEVSFCFSIDLICLSFFVFIFSFKGIMGGFFFLFLFLFFSFSLTHTKKHDVLI